MSLKHGILGLLNYAPLTGYNLKKVFDTSVNNIWTASLSQIYRELGMLEKGGLVSSRIEAQDDRPDKRIYCISDAGRQEFMAWLTEDSDVFISPKRDEFMLKMFFSSNLGKADVRRRLVQFVEDRKSAMLGIENLDVDKLKMVASVFAGKFNLNRDDARYMRFILKRAHMSNKILVQWGEECIKELDEEI